MLDCSQKNRNYHSVDVTGVAFLQKVFTAKCARRGHYLRDGKAWLSYDN